MQRRCDAGSPFCLNGRLEGREAAGLRSLRRALTPPNRSVSAQELQRFFELTSDQCERGDILIEHGQLVNHGKACTLTTDIPSTNASVTIFIPSAMEGRHESLLNGDMSLQLNDPHFGPSLRFMPEYLNADWGGEI